MEVTVPLKRRWPVTPARLVALLVLAGIVAAASVWWWSNRPGEPSPRRLAQIASLPATPQDMERRSAAVVASAALPEDRARALNAAVAFRELGKAARPFRFKGDEADRLRARECLATAMLYEAGDDPLGQESVAQVVLNRARHPAYPATVCGVVYQGAHLPTGCQFTFTCDGSLRRAWPAAARERARKLADKFLDGHVFEQVGLATHYHTDWVHPYWSNSLEKIAKVRTHLFFRWPGWWGTTRAFYKTYRGGEPEISASPAARLAAAPAGEPVTQLELVPEPVITDALPRDLLTAPRLLADVPPPAGFPAAALLDNRLVLAHPEGGAFGVLIKQGAPAHELISVALRLCQGERLCNVMAWVSEQDVPRGFPIGPTHRAALAFEYFRDSVNGTDKVLFNCGMYPRANSEQCFR